MIRRRGRLQRRSSVPRRLLAGWSLPATGRLLLLAVLGGCAATGSPPVTERSPVFSDPQRGYQVQPGDTLYSVAWRFGLDHRALARTNGLAAPYTIYVGQQLRLVETPPPPTARGPGQRPVPAAPEEPPPAPVSGWRAPTDAPVQRSYGDGNRGIDYRLDLAHPVQSAAAGEVVYAGSGLGGFRHLVIVAHNPRYLSAYGFDRSPAVREGQIVKAGADLADKGDGVRRIGTLHFEIRRDGDPVDPRDLIGRH